MIQSLLKHSDWMEEIKAKARRHALILTVSGNNGGILGRDCNCACVIEEQGSRIFEYTTAYIENLLKTSQLLEREEPESIIEKYRLRHICTGHALYAFKRIHKTSN